MKRHQPAAFLAGLLNAYPMGFYAPAQLVRDARRHGVEVKPIDARFSIWDCTLEGERGPAAVRTGLRMIKGLGQAAAERLVAAHTALAFVDVADLARRAPLDRKDFYALARAGALSGLAGHLRNALWQVTRVEASTPVLRDPTPEEVTPCLIAPTEGHDIVQDYAAIGLTLGRHLLALLRPALQRRRLSTAAELSGYRHGQLARTTDLVTHRQHPETANGVIFITLEDETGHVNVVAWNVVAEAQRSEVHSAKLLTVFWHW